MPHNPFGDDAGAPQRVNPFGDDDAEAGVDAAARLEHAAGKIRRLRSQLGAEGLTPGAMRELMDALASGFEAAAQAVREAGSGS
jgi:hypothetical protein